MKSLVLKNKRSNKTSLLNSSAGDNNDYFHLQIAVVNST